MTMEVLLIACGWLNSYLGLRSQRELATQQKPADGNNWKGQGRVVWPNWWAGACYAVAGVTAAFPNLEALPHMELWTLAGAAGHAAICLIRKDDYRKKELSGKAPSSRTNNDEAPASASTKPSGTSLAATIIGGSTAVATYIVAPAAAIVGGIVLGKLMTLAGHHLDRMVVLTSRPNNKDQDR